MFAALGGLFAVTIGLNRVRFYQNGVISFNLPPSAQIVGARASRTTHPRVLAAFGDLLTGIMGRPFRFANPFLWKTKTDVVEVLRDNRCADLTGCATSCGHTWDQTTEHTHCGMCSQCIDRRLAVLAAGLGEHDPAGAYRRDPALGEPPDDYAKTMLTAYMEMVERVEQMTATAFVSHFGELARAQRHIPGNPAAAALQVYDLYRRHAGQERGAVNRLIAEHADAVSRRRLPPGCLLRLVYEGEVVGGSEVVAPPPPAPPAGNYYERRGEYWAIRFGTGVEKYDKADIGFEYLRVLLEHPRSKFGAADLATRVQERNAPTLPRGVTVEDAAAAGVGSGTLSGGDHALSDEGLVKALARLKELAALRALAEASDSPRRLDLVDDMTAEEAAIRAQIRKDRGLGGESRELGDVRNQIRNRLSVAVRRARKEDRQGGQTPCRPPHAPDPLARPLAHLPARLHGEVDVRRLTLPKNSGCDAKCRIGDAARLASVFEARPGESSPASRHPAAFTP